LAAGATLNLDPGGKFAATSLPAGFLRMDGMKQEQATSGAGTWSLIRRDGSDRVSLIFTTIDGGALLYGTEIDVQGSGSQVRLFYYKGDPDEDQRIYFRRE
jgi:hypothetical protein